MCRISTKSGAIATPSAATGAPQRVIYVHALLSDENETAESIRAALDAKLPSLPRRNRLAVVGIGGINARAEQHWPRSSSGSRAPYRDPVAPSTAAQASAWPLVADAIAAAGIGCNVYNRPARGVVLIPYWAVPRDTQDGGRGYALGDLRIASRASGFQR